MARRRGSPIPKLEELLIKRKAKKRPLTEHDINSWLKAADARTGPVSREEIIAYFKSKNAHRWWRINYDVRWIKKQMVRLGLNPEDWKELL